MSEGHKDFVRDCLYPLDTALHRRVCNSDGLKMFVLPGNCSSDGDATLLVQWKQVRVRLIAGHMLAA